VEKGCAILGSVEGRNWEILGLIHFSVFIVGMGFMVPLTGGAGVLYVQELYLLI
jgi:hypothetical protein